MIFDLLDEFNKIVPSQKVVRRVFGEIEAGNGQISVGQIAEKLEKGQTEVSTAITSLVKAGFIYQPEKTGKTKFYMVHPEISRKEAALTEFLKHYEP